MQVQTLVLGHIEICTYTLDTRLYAISNVSALTYRNLYLQTDHTYVRLYERLNVRVLLCKQYESYTMGTRFRPFPTIAVCTSE